MSNYNLMVLLIIFGVLVLAAIGAGTFLLWHRQRTRRLREQFGPEYDRTIASAGGRKAAEAELLERRRRHNELKLRTLDSAQLSQFQQRWTDMQREFVDDPAGSVHDADRLVVDVMDARGYSTGDLDRRADDLSVDHPHIAQHYRDAREIAGADKRGKAGTEDLRKALTSYRTLLDELLTEASPDGVEGGIRGRRGRQRNEARDSDGRRVTPDGRVDRDLDRDGRADRDRKRDGLADRDRNRDGRADRDRNHDRVADRDRNHDGPADRDRDHRLADRDGNHDGRVDRDEHRDRELDRDADRRRLSTDRETRT